MNSLFSLPFCGVVACLAFGHCLASFKRAPHPFVIYGVCVGVCLVGLWMELSPEAVCDHLSHVVKDSYLPFLAASGALFTVTGGIHLTTATLMSPSSSALSSLEKKRGAPVASPALNMGILAVGSVLASMIGTTGASLLLIRPLIRLNQNRSNLKPLLVFFIFIVSNIGGALSPLGDAPLFMGYLLGVDFTWPARFLWMPWALCVFVLLPLSFFIDRFLWNQEKKEGAVCEEPILKRRWIIEGKSNFIFLLCIVLTLWQSQRFASIPMGREGVLIALAGLSFFLTDRKIYEKNTFSWSPFFEVAVVFLALFITLIPIETMLKMGPEGPFQAFLAMANPQGVPNPRFYFWGSGILSAFLDNAPTYLLFFHMAGGHAESLMTSHSQALVALSCGSVFMGALSYIGNAPNLIVRSLAVRANITMPSFFGYMIWAFGLLMPLFYGIDWMIQKLF